MSVVLGHNNKTPVGCACCICGEVYYSGEISGGYANTMMGAWADHMKVHSRLRKLWAKVVGFPRWVRLKRFQRRTRDFGKHV